MFSSRKIQGDWGNKMHLVDRILDEDAEALTGADLFMYNVACQIHNHSNMDWNVWAISDLISQIEQWLDEREE